MSRNKRSYLQNEVKVKVEDQAEHRSIRFGVFRPSTSTLALAFRWDAQWEINQPPISEELTSKLGEIVVTLLGGRSGTSTAITQEEEEQASLEESRTRAVEDHWKLPFQEGATSKLGGSRRHADVRSE